MRRVHPARSLLALALLCTLSGTSSSLLYAQNTESQELRVKTPVIARDGIWGELWLYPNPKDSSETQIDSNAIYEILKKRFQDDSFVGLEFLKNNERVSFKELDQAGIKASFNEEELVLNLDIDPTRLKQTQLNLLEERDGESGALILRPTPWSGFVNLKGNLDFDKESVSPAWERSNFYVEIDWIHSQGNLRFVNRFNAFEESDRFIHRKESYLFYDLEKESARITVGDIYPRTRSFQRSRSLLGVTFNKESQLQRWWQYQNTASKEIILDSPSTVEIYINGTLRDRIEAPAGPLLLDQIPLYAGRNNLEIRIRDRFGKVQIITDSFVHEQSLLKKGRHDYALSSGFASKAFRSDRLYETDEIYLSGFHRYGLLETLELGWNAQATSETWMMGLEARNVNPWGLWSTSFSDSANAQAHNGQAALLSWNSLEVLRPLPYDPSLNTQLEWQSRKFISPLAAQASSPFQARFLQTLAIRTPVNINHIFSYYRTWPYDEVATNSARYDIRKTFSREWSVSASYEVQWDEERRNQFYISLGWLESRKNIRAQTDYSSQNKSTRLEVEHNPNEVLENFHQRATLENSNIQSRVSAEAGYRGRRGLSSVEYQNIKGRGVSANTHTVSLNASTALAYTPNAFGIGQPIYDSFAIFRAKPSLSRGNELHVGASTNDNATIIDSIGPGVLSNLSSQNARLLQISSGDPDHPIHVQDEFVKLDPKFYRGIEMIVEQSKPLALQGTLINLDKTKLSYHSGKWEIFSSEGPLIDSGEIFTSAEGEFFIESKMWGASLTITINYPTSVSFQSDLRSFENSAQKVSDLGEVQAR